MNEYAGCHMYDECSDEIIKPATDVFEIEDFTAATDWENFMDEMENVFRGWKLCGPRPANVTPESRSGEWKYKHAELRYLDFPFSVRYCVRGGNEEEQTEDCSMILEEGNESVQEARVMEDLTCSSFDFCDSGPIPSTLFGLTEMIIISPAGREILGNETRAGQVLGAVNIALHNTGCTVPVLVQAMEPRKQLYVGTAIANNCRTEISSVLLNKRPGHVTHLTGLLQLFKNRISNPLPVEISPAIVSVRLSYHLEDWASYSWSVDPPDLDLFTLSGDSDFIQLKEIPLGCVSDPVSGLTLHTSWRDLSEELIVDNSVHSDLDSMEAPEWSVSITLQEKPECLLGKHLGGVIDIYKDPRSLKDILGDIIEESETSEVSGLFDKLSGPQVPGVSSYSLTDLARKVRPLRSRTPTGGPLNPALLKYVLTYLFPDAEETSVHPYLEVGALNNNGPASELYGGCKSCPEDGLAWRLTTTLACCLGWAGAGGVAHLLHEFCMEVRYRWENGIELPGLPSGPPDTGTSLLHQKLQMLNCCILHRRNSIKRSASTNLTPARSVEAAEDSDDTDYDEFYECEEEEGKEVEKEDIEEEEKNEVTKETKEVDREEEKSDLPVWETAEGRAERIGQLRLLGDKDWLYRPEVQEPAPLTEDQLAEQAEVLMQLGSDQSGSEVRARLQSVNLLSDMESFKAANPGSELADFVRWHSPRDYEEGVGMSARMKAPGNMWTDLWEQARAVPAHRQKRLFDETREAEKVLQFLTSLGAGDLAQLTLPTLLQACHYRILSCVESSAFPNLHKSISKSVVSMSHLLCLPEVKHYRGNVKLDEFFLRENMGTKTLELLTSAEVGVSRLLSLKRKFLYDLTLAEEEEEADAIVEMERFVESLCGGGEVRVRGAARGPAGRLIQAMFRESQQSSHPREEGLPPPNVKQFVLRCVSGRPLPSSRPTPQRMYARIGAGEFRLTGAFTLDRQYL